MNSLDEMYDWMKDRARDVFNDAGHHVPLFGIQTPDGKIAIIGAPWHSEEEKDIAVREIRRACKEMNAIRVVVITEGWLRGPTNRSEILMITGQSGISGERERAGYYEIERDKGGKATVGKFVATDAPGYSSTSIYDGLVGKPVLH